ncbi:hypothetical protein [Dyadobacter fanqingshengii]|uniref:Cbb3-type cytochrome c oxidase subunit 3 n=1 Tax=Dyadobacter fanqingshengii TaxID=2906443 RepID=A0A9X1P6D9_9BACT|nr:hypothetical protein [Dyadobacter fanqingshengii]MCF0039714.1 hypothetical protein [Dyadobacter fanqingshengii]USJ38523.1 hypothetical protein NFI81_12225 [Dyadobacter fanqingshengii]
MKKPVLTLLLILIRLVSLACPVCDQRQPKVLKGITHGTGPESNWDYVIIITAIAIVIFTLFFSVKWLINPGEAGNDHIKKFILTNP